MTVALAKRIEERAKLNPQFLKSLTKHYSMIYSGVIVQADGSSKVIINQYNRLHGRQAQSPPKGNAPDAVEEESGAKSGAWRIDYSPIRQFVLWVVNFFRERWILASPAWRCVLVGPAVLVMLIVVVLALIVGPPLLVYEMTRKPPLVIGTIVAEYFVYPYLIGLLWTLIFPQSLAVSPPEPIVCSMRQLVSGAGTIDTLSAVTVEPFDLQVDTSVGKMLIRPDIKAAPCESMALKKFILDGHFRPRRCDRIDFQVVRCFPELFHARDEGFRVKRTGGESPPRSRLEIQEGTVFLGKESYDSLISGLISFMGNSDSDYPSNGKVFGQIIEGLNHLDAVIDAGSKSNFIYASSDLNKPFTIKSISVVLRQ